MARLSREESQSQTRARLLDAAREVFAQHGFAAASVDRIADYAGYSKGAVYSNFAGKEELFLELLKARMAEELMELRQLLAQTGTAAEILDALQAKYSSIDRQMVWCMLSMEFQLQAGRDPKFAGVFASLYRAQRSAVAGLIRAVAKKSGTAAPGNAAEIATGMMALMNGVVIQRAADPKSVPAATAGRAMRLFLAAGLNTGLNKKKGTKSC